MLVRRLLVPAPEGVQPGPEVQSFQLRIDVMKPREMTGKELANTIWGFSGTGLWKSVPPTARVALLEAALRAEQRDSLMEALVNVTGCLAWHVETRGCGVAMDAERLRVARELIASVED
jgi:hypothetical protein